MAARSSSSIMCTTFLILAHMAVFSELSAGCDSILKTSTHLTWQIQRTRLCPTDKILFIFIMVFRKFWVDASRYRKSLIHLCVNYEYNRFGVAGNDSDNNYSYSVPFVLHKAKKLENLTSQLKNGRQNGLISKKF